VRQAEEVRRGRVLAGPSDLAALLILAAMGLWLFRMHLLGDSTFIGDSDRLNTFLNIRKFEVDSIQRLGRVPAWNDLMFLGFGTFGLHYMLVSADPIAYLEALFPIQHLFRVSGFVSCGFLVLSGWVAFWFMKDTCGDSFSSLVGAGLYSLSAFSILRISQVDNAFSVLICLPAGLLFLRRVGVGRTGWCLVGLSVTIAYLLLFTFLQEVAYGLILLAAYAVFRSLWLRSLRPALVYGSSLVVAIIASLPRLYTVSRDFALLQRSALGYELRDFETTYRLLGTRPREWLRWFDDGIFGRFPEEAASLGNGINLHEGLLLYTSTFAALLVVWGAIRFRGEWFRLPRFKDEDAPFHLWFLILVGVVVLAKPAWQTLYVLFQKVDFTHARIVVAGLLPFCTLVAILMRDLRPSPATEIQSGVRAWVVALSFVGAASILLVIDCLVQRVGDVTRVPLNASLGDLARMSLLLLVFGTVPGVPVTSATVITENTWLRAGGLLQVECGAVVFAMLVMGIWVGRKRQRMTGVLWYCLGFLMLLQGIAYADAQLNGEHTRRKVPFQGNNLLTARADEFRPPGSDVMSAFHARLEANEYRTALVCGPSEFPAFCAPHLSQFWRLRVAEGYMSGVPMRLAQLPWPEEVLGPRSLSFASMETLPWSILSLLNVKYALAVNAAFYENRVSDRAVGQRGVEPLDVAIRENPLPVVPRQFFTASVEPVGSVHDAIRLLFSREPSKELALEVRRNSLVEGYPSRERFSVNGTIRARYRGDTVEVAFDAAKEPRFLVLNELYHPDWRAYAGEVELPVYATNVVMRGIVVPPGESQIVLRFTPVLRIGLGLLCLATAGSAGFLAGWGLSRYDSRGAKGDLSHVPGSGRRRGGA
jgi:hypothetical protein